MRDSARLMNGAPTRASFASTTASWALPTSMGGTIARRKRISAHSRRDLPSSFACSLSFVAWYSAGRVRLRTNSVIEAAVATVEANAVAIKPLIMSFMPPPPKPPPMLPGPPPIPPPASAAASTSGNSPSSSSPSISRDLSVSCFIGLPNSSTGSPISDSKSCLFGLPNSSTDSPISDSPSSSLKDRSSYTNAWVSVLVASAGTPAVL